MQRDWEGSDFYQTLGVEKTASREEISKAYRALARKHHPDVNLSNNDSGEKFKEISRAYEVLKDEESRREYDEYLRLKDQPLEEDFGSQEPWAGGFSGQRPHWGGDFGAGRMIFEEQTIGRRGRDLTTSLVLPLSDMVYGTVVMLHYHTEVACAGCKGSGASVGSRVKPCKQCRGSGMINMGEGTFMLPVPCPRCEGRGDIISKPCNDCCGNGVVVAEKSAAVKVPSGLPNNSKLKIAKQGGAGRNNADPGDLYVVCIEEPHSFYKREGLDLLVETTIPMTTAALGGDCKIPALDGGVLTARIKPGIQSGGRIKLRGLGVKYNGMVGDLIATILVEIPTNLSAKQRDLLEQFKEAQLRGE